MIVSVAVGERKVKLTQPTSQEDSSVRSLSSLSLCSQGWSCVILFFLFKKQTINIYFCSWSVLHLVTGSFISTLQDTWTNWCERAFILHRVNGWNKNKANSVRWVNGKFICLILICASGKLKLQSGSLIIFTSLSSPHTIWSWPPDIILTHCKHQKEHVHLWLTTGTADKWQEYVCSIENLLPSDEAVLEWVKGEGQSDFKINTKLQPSKENVK